VIDDLPFGRGARFLHTSKLLDYAAGGWTMTGTTSKVT
jgi:hypothetical protein